MSDPVHQKESEPPALPLKESEPPALPMSPVACDSPGVSHVIDLEGVTPVVSEETINADPVTNKESEHELLHQLSAAAIESGADLGESSCYLPAFGFKGPEMEAAYSAFHSPTVLRGHQIFASVNAFFLLVRIANLLAGNNYLEASALAIFSLSAVGLVALLSASCCVYFSGQVMKLHQQLSQVTNAIGLLAVCGWLAQFVDVCYYQTDWDKEKPRLFHCAYFIGMISSMGPTFCLVMLRMPFHWCSAAHLVLGLILIFSSYVHGTDVASFVALPLMQVLVLYSIENASRLTFIANMRSAKLAADIRQAASKAEASAFQAINHCAKRVMYNTVLACSDLKRDTIPKLLAAPVPVLLVHQLTEIIECVETDCQVGFGKCRDAIALKQLYSGEYQPVVEPVCIRAFITETWGRIPNLTLEIDDTVPQWVSLCIPLLLIIMQNAIHNAKSHGKRNGDMQLTVKLIQVGHDWFLQVHLQNKPGNNHDAAIQMQSELGQDMLLSAQNKDTLGKIGNAMSTFLGMAEIQIAASALSATTNLLFYPITEAGSGCVVFTVQMPLVVANARCVVDDNTPLQLRDGTFMICADDDKIARMMYKSLSKKCGATEFQVLGETFDEADSIVSTVKTVAAQHGEANVVVLLDQNMDNYPEGKVFGTEVTHELRSDGFKGIILIRSANDDAASANKYRRAGANGCVGKTLKSSALVGDIVKQCNLAWEMVT